MKLGDMGPNMDLTLRRFSLGGDDMWKAACKQPITLDFVLFKFYQICCNYFVVFFSAKVKKVKNIEVTGMGDKVGRIHMKKQNLDTMNSRRVTALRDTRPKKRGRQSERDEPAIVEEVSSGRSRGGKRSRTR